MHTTEAFILAIGRNSEILAIVVRLLNNHPSWTAIGALTDDEAIKHFQETKIDIVMLCGGITEEEEAMLRTTFLQQDPAVTIIQHYGGGSGLLSNEVMEALDKKQGPSF